VSTSGIPLGNRKAQKDRNVLKVDSIADIATGEGDVGKATHFVADLSGSIHEYGSLR
jgi:hypothetical protein